MRALARAVSCAGCCVGVLIATNAPAAAAPFGVIEGTVLNETTGRPQPRVPVTLTRGRRDAEGSSRTTRVTDARGRYRFRVRTGEELFYVVDARYRSGLFAGRPISIPSDTAEPPVVRTKLRVWDTTRDPAAIFITRDALFVVPGEGDVAVIESVRVVNQTQLAYIGRATRRGRVGTKPTLGFALPSGASRGGVEILDSTIDIPTLARTSFGFAATVAIPPGETRMTFTYRVPGDAGSFDLSRTALYGIAEATVHATEPLDVESNRLVDQEPVTVGGKRYARWSTTEPLDPGDPLQVVAIARAGPSPALLGGIAAAAALAVVAAVLTIGRARSHGKATTPPAGDAAEEGRDELATAIAELDLRYEAGELEEAAWQRERAELKSRLAAARSAAER